MSAERTRRLALALSVLAVLAAIVTAFAIGRTTLPDGGGGWLFALIAGAVAVAFGVGAVVLLRRLDD